MQTCETCAHWVNEVTDDESGLCKRLSTEAEWGQPPAFNDGPGGFWTWPEFGCKAWEASDSE